MILKNCIFQWAWANTIPQSFYAVHLVSRIFGVSYFTNIVTTSSWFMNVPYTLSVLIIFIGAFSYRISSVPPNFCRSDAVSHSVIGIQQILTVVTISAIFYQILFYKDQFRKLLECTSSIEYEFNVLNIEFSCKHFMAKIIIEVATIIILIYMSFLFFVIHYDVKHLGLILLELFSYMNPMLVIILNLITFLNVVWYIRIRFQHLKCFLMNLCPTDPPSACRLNEPQKVKLSRTSNALHRDFSKIAHIYELLFTESNYLSDIFGCSNLTSMGKTNHSRNRFKIKLELISDFFLFTALFSISLTCHLFLLFKLLTENTNNMDDIQFDVLGSIQRDICHTLIELNGLNDVLNLIAQLQSYG